MFLFSWEPSISKDYLLALAVLVDGGGGGGEFLLVGVIQESFSRVKIKLHVDFQPTSLLLLMLQCERSELAALELPVFSGGFGRGQGV